MPKGLDEETFGAEFKQRKTGKITRKQRRSESEVSVSDEKDGNGRCYGICAVDCFAAVDVSDYRFG